MNESLLLAVIGLGTGTMLGLAARLGRFCSLGAIEDIVYGGRYYRALMWPAAMGWSMIGIGILIACNQFELANAVYLRVQPNYLAFITGGLLFGFGMAMTGMCGFTALARIGTGDMRALFVTIIIGISAYVVSSGPMAHFRENYFPYQILSDGKMPSFASYIAMGTGVPMSWVFVLTGLLFISLPMLRLNFRRSIYPFWAFIVGAAICLGWWGTYWVSQVSFDPVTVLSHSFSLPLGDTILFLMTSTGSVLNFPIGSVAGVIIGAVLGSLIKNEFSWEACDDARELRRHIFGAILMGVGAVIAFGCSIGQGLSAMALLSFGAPVTLLAISVGSYIGLKYLIEG